MKILKMAPDGAEKILRFRLFSWAVIASRPQKSQMQPFKWLKKVAAIDRVSPRSTSIAPKSDFTLYYEIRRQSTTAAKKLIYLIDIKQSAREQIIISWEKCHISRLAWNVCLCEIIMKFINARLPGKLALDTPVHRKRTLGAKRYKPNVCYHQLMC